jgi:2Fe-2S ferredoxin
MKKITVKIKNLQNRTLEIVPGGVSLLALFQQHRIDWMHACGGKGRCTTCKAIIREGQHNLPALTEAEQRMAQRGRLQETERLSCQLIPEADLVVEVPVVYQLPHIRYSD